MAEGLDSVAAVVQVALKAFGGKLLFDLIHTSSLSVIGVEHKQRNANCMS